MKIDAVIAKNWTSLKKQLPQSRTELTPHGFVCGLGELGDFPLSLGFCANGALSSQAKNLEASLAARDAERQRLDADVRLSAQGKAEALAAWLAKNRVSAELPAAPELRRRLAALESEIGTPKTYTSGNPLVDELRAGEIRQALQRMSSTERTSFVAEHAQDAELMAAVRNAPAGTLTLPAEVLSRLEGEVILAAPVELLAEHEALKSLLESAKINADHHAKVFG